MKQKFTLLVVSAMCLFPAWAQQKYEIGNPNNAAHSYLNDYRPLKEYINYEKYPNFKLGIGTTVSEYLNNNSLVKGLTNDNFTETVAGNAMKMGSCVDGNGNMNFTTVTNYVNAATEAGLNVYGHTLAWHSQQPVAWLRSLIKDKPDPNDKDAQTSYVKIASKDFTAKSDQSIGWGSEQNTYGYSVTFTSEDGMKIHTTKNCANFWDVQFQGVTDLTLTKGANYKVTFKIRGSEAGKLHTKLGDFTTSGVYAEVPFTTEWTDVEITYANCEGGGFMLMQCGDFVGDIFVKSVIIEKEQLGKTIPLTQEEKLEALTGAMEKWIKGMMEACGGKVKAWDVVNEAINGEGNDGEGNYTLQHAKGYVPGATSWDVGGDAFFWQDHMGDLEYVRTAVRLARKYGPEDVKLFINDYNLESTWDDNKKVKSLINWIKKWEADGETVIDGIGTQMHISYFRNKTDQDRQKKHITQMFELMAASGKLVRVSEMDMGVAEKQFGTAIKTANITAEDEKAMADYYQWIYEEYLRIIPADQQWGICQWCPTDAPDYDYVWRRGEPLGYWTLDYYRKPAYAGVAEGLGGVVYNGIDEVTEEGAASAAPIYDLQGNPVNTSIENLPAGFYVVGGRKVVK